MICTCPNCSKFKKFGSYFDTATESEAGRPEPKVCRYNHGTGSECDCNQKDEVEDRAVEEKIQAIAQILFPNMKKAKEAFIPTLRELVKLARNTK